ncbi:RNA methyltransferase [Kordiimonas aquimaris]|uniref:RNA methyltransferase n=1 Tax=Kordiimonas aquimaris TaxID=707591 RepID=UPI0021D0E3A4|nr:RNA methyltransferase [Kordiimonas aquimaris]
MGRPAIILVQPQLGENIGKTARAMLNFGLTDLRLVAPRDGWPNPSAGPSASGADVVLDNARVFDDVASAIDDCHHVYASTVRPRDMIKPVVTPREAAAEINALTENHCTAILFGREASGLSNDDIAYANSIVTVPVNPDFGSLNLAQAVILMAYELYIFGNDTPHYQPGHAEGLASKKEMEGLHSHLTGALEERGYFRSAERRTKQEHTLRNVMQNASFSSQEVQTLRGVIKSLIRDKC